jgi:hypothetical protein
MAYGKSTNKTIEDSITPSTVLSPGLSGGNVRCFVDTYVGTGLEAGDTLTVEIGPTLPVGARVLWVSIMTGANGTTVHVGDAEDTDRYLNAAAASTITSTGDVATGLGYEVDMTTAATPDNQILLTWAAAPTAATSQTLVVLYTVE